MWIKWEDREPEPGKQILISGFNHNRPGAGRWVDAVWYDGLDFYDEEDDMDCKNDPVDLYPPTHWMSLPQAPTD